MTLAPTFEVSFELSLVSLNAIKKAAYKFADKWYVQISNSDPNCIRVTLQCKKPGSELHDPRGELQNEVLDQDLREIVLNETRGMRNLIMAQAYSPISLLDHVAETADFLDDPIHIRAQDGSSRA